MQLPYHGFWNFHVPCQSALQLYHHYHQGKGASTVQKADWLIWHHCSARFQFRHCAFFCSLKINFHICQVQSHHYTDMAKEPPELAFELHDKAYTQHAFSVFHVTAYMRTPLDKSVLPLWVFRCHKRLFFCTKLHGHRWHWKGLSPVWTRMWVTRLFFCTKALPQ